MASMKTEDKARAPISSGESSGGGSGVGSMVAVGSNVGRGAGEGVGEPPQAESRRVMMIEVRKVRRLSFIAIL
jgi:hypothetical protein